MRTLTLLGMTAAAALAASPLHAQAGRLRRAAVPMLGALVAGVVVSVGRKVGSVTADLAPEGASTAPMERRCATESALSSTAVSSPPVDGGRRRSGKAVVLRSSRAKHSCS